MNTTFVEFTVKMSEFKRKLRATYHATASANHFQMLNLIKVTVESSQIMLIATDRYKIIATRQETIPNTAHTTGTVLLSPKALKYLGMMSLSSDNKLTVRANENGLLKLETKEETLTIHQAEDTYPGIETILRDYIDAEPTAQILGFAPKHLDSVVKSFKGLYPNEAIVIQGTPTSKPDTHSPAMIYGAGVDDWVAMLMPVRAGNTVDATQAARKAFAYLLSPGEVQSQEES